MLLLLLLLPTVVPADVADPARLSFVVPPGAHIARAMVPSTRTLNAARSAGGPREESKRGVLTGIMLAVKQCHDAAGGSTA
jgi:hypothetical protein